MSNNINIAQLCVSPPEESNDYAQIYVTDPEKKFLEKFGKLAILISIHLKGPPSHKATAGQGVLENDTHTRIKNWTQNFIDFSSSEFYKTLKTGDNLPKEFEDLLQSINIWILKEKDRSKDIFEKYIDDINIEIIAWKFTQISFASIGDIKTSLISLAPRELIQKLSARNSKTTKFSNLMSGSLEKDNILLVTSPNIFDYFSAKKITQLFCKKPLKNAIEEIKQLLTDNAIKTAVLILAISNRDESVIAQSLEHGSKEISSKQEKLSVKINKDYPAEENKREREREIVPTIISSSKRMYKILNIVTKKVLPGIDKTLQKIKKHRPKITMPQKIKTHNIMWQKIVFIILIILALLFTVSIIFLGKQQHSAQRRREYARNLQSLKEIESKISLALIYEDDSNVQTLLLQMNSLFGQLPQKTTEQKQTYKLFSDKYNTTLHKFYRITRLDDPGLLIDMLNQHKNINPSGMTNLFNDFYIFDSSNNYIYRFNVETFETEVVNSISTNVGRLKKLMPLDNDILIGYDTNYGIVTFNTIDNKLEPIKLVTKHDVSEITDLYLYNDRLYLLESPANQIYKYSKTIDGFGSEEDWIADGTNVSDAFAISIDGSIYALKQSADIYKFFQGNRADFELSNILPLISLRDPQIARPIENIKFITTADMKYLYLLDGGSNRLIILSKTGKLIKQFTSPHFTNLIDVIISRDENTAWLLNGTKIYKIDL